MLGTLDTFTASLIGGYQRYLSPHKGFRCAHRALHGGPSCSEFARRVILRRGVGRLAPLLRRRFARCAAAARRLRAIAAMHQAAGAPRPLDYAGPGTKPKARESDGSGRAVPGCSCSEAGTMFATEACCSLVPELICSAV